MNSLENRSNISVCICILPQNSLSDLNKLSELQNHLSTSLFTFLSFKHTLPEDKRCDKCIIFQSYNCLREQILRRKKYQTKTHPSTHPSIAFCLSDSRLLAWRRGLASCPSYYEVTKPPKNVNILVQQRYFSSFPLDLLWIFQFTSWIIITVRISILWLNNAH